MRANGSMGIAAAALCAMVVALLVAAAPAKPQPATWEYKVVGGPLFPDDYATAPNGLNAMGAEGWELIAVGSRDGNDPSQHRYYFFKRPK